MAGWKPVQESGPRRKLWYYKAWQECNRPPESSLLSLMSSSHGWLAGPPVISWTSLQMPYGSGLRLIITKRYFLFFTWADGWTIFCFLVDEKIKLCDGCNLNCQPRLQVNRVSLTAVVVNTFSSRSEDSTLEVWVQVSLPATAPSQL